ncbi:MAG: LysM peptidoglycan-binding domain-containing protein [Flavobacteriaceae bacterium]|nr:LysM peptidoglycan-binding domain-containing protein [Flavobacteriaceae bacterium]
MKNFKHFIILFFIGTLVAFSQQKKFITYQVLEGETIQSISKNLSITPYDLLKLNPDVKDQIHANDIIIIPNKAYDPKSDIENSDLSIVGDKDIIVDNFIYHEVLKKETLYSLLKKFEVSVEELNSLNPQVLKSGLKQGQILKLPIKISALQISEKEKYTQPYIVKPKETKYSIARNYGISIAYLEALNPTIKEKGLQFDDVILVPNKTIDNSEFKTHKVEKQETLFSLSNKFGVSQEELIEANPQLEQGVIAGMVIKIPNIDIEENKNFIDKRVEGISLDVAMMLPFMSKRDSLNFENDRLLNITTDFYFGALQALDSLKNKGLSVRLKVYDTENSAYVSKKLSLGPEFENFDVVIGPMFLNNVKAVSENLTFKKSMIISPISNKDHSKISNKNLVQEVTSKENLTFEMLQFIKSNYKGQKLLIIVDEKDAESYEFNKIFKEIQTLDTLNQISVIKPVKGYIKPTVFRENVLEEIENWVLLIGNDQTFLRDVFNNLGVLPEEFNITLFSFEKGRNYDKIDNNYLSRVNYHYPTSDFLDRDSKAYANFKSKYKSMYHSLPSKYAIDGFDITYDILMRLSVNTDLINQGTSKRLAAKYKFIENTSGAMVNHGVFIVKYDGLELKLVE